MLSNIYTFVYTKSKILNFFSKRVKSITKVLSFLRALLALSLAQIWLSVKQSISGFIKVFYLLIFAVCFLKHFLFSNDIVKLSTSSMVLPASNVLCTQSFFIQWWHLDSPELNQHYYFQQLKVINISYLT